MSYYHSKDEPRVIISREWTELIAYLEKDQPDRWLRIFQGAVGYALGEHGKPDFSDDSELQALWEKTNCRPFDKNTLKQGWLRVWKRKGGANDGRR